MRGALVTVVMISSRGWWSCHSDGGFCGFFVFVFTNLAFVGENHRRGLVCFVFFLIVLADLGFVGENRCRGLVGFVFF